MISSTQMVRISAIACTLIASTHLYAMHSGNAIFKRAQEATSTLIDGRIETQKKELSTAIKGIGTTKAAQDKLDAFLTWAKAQDRLLSDDQKKAVTRIRKNALRAIDGMQDRSDNSCEESPANSESPTNLPGSDISQPSTPPLAATAEESSSPESTPTALVQSLTAMAKPVMGKNCMAVAPKALIRDVRGTRPGQPGYEKEFPSLGAAITQPKKAKFERTKKKRPVVAHAAILPKVAQPMRDETALVLSQPHLKFQEELGGLENAIRTARADKTKRTDMSELQERMKTARHIIDGKQLASQDDCQRFTNIEHSWFAWLEELLEELNHSQKNTDASLYKTPFVVSQGVAQAIIPAASTALVLASAVNTAPVVPARAPALNISDALVEPAAVVAPVVASEPVASSVDAKVPVAPVMRKSHQARVTNLVKEMPITFAHSDISASVASAAAPKGIAEVAAKAAEVAVEATGPKIRSARSALIIQPTAHNRLVAADTQVPTTPVLAPAPALNVSDALAEHANATVEEVAVESAASPEAEPVQPALVQAASVADNPLIVANEGMSVDNKRILASARVREMRGMFHTHRDYARNFPTLDTKPVAQAPAVEPMAARTPINLGELEALCQLINAHRQHVQATGDDTLDERDREIIRTLSKGLEKLRKMATRGQLNDEDLTYFKRIKAQYEDILPSKWPVHTLAAGVVAEESAIVPFVEPVNAEPASVGAAVVAALIPAANNALVEYAPRTATVAVADIAPAPVAEVAVGNSAEPALAPVGQSVVAAPEVIANRGNAALVDHNPAAVGQLQVARTNGWWRSWGRQATWCALPVVIAIIAAVIGRKNGASWWPWRTTLRRHRVRPIRVP